MSKVLSASLINKEFAVEVGELSRLIKGYGSTHRRGLRNFLYIMDNLVNPILKAGEFPNDAAEKLRLARNTVNKDPNASNPNKRLT